MALVLVVFLYLAIGVGAAGYAAYADLLPAHNGYDNTDRVAAGFGCVTAWPFAIVVFLAAKAVTAGEELRKLKGGEE